MSVSSELPPKKTVKHYGYGRLCTVQWANLTRAPMVLQLHTVYNICHVFHMLTVDDDQLLMMNLN